MSTQLPAISGDQLVRALGRVGWTVTRQEGSHVRLIRSGCAPITVPRHRTLKRGTLAAILRQAGMVADELRDLL
jgi:predicted RNA binding protein YcfA (HicA-like mRNA interferase family)